MPKVNLDQLTGAEREIAMTDYPYGRDREAVPA